MTSPREIIERAIDQNLSQVLMHCTEKTAPIAGHYSIEIMADAALKALADNGLVIVPREPTKEMLDAIIMDPHVLSDWKAMIEAWEQSE